MQEVLRMHSSISIESFFDKTKDSFDLARIRERSKANN